MTEPASRTRPRPLASELFSLLSGPVVWALHFTLAYAFHATLCARSASLDDEKTVADLAAPIILAITVGALLLLGLFACKAVAGRGEPAGAFDRRVAAALILLSAIGVTWAGASALIIEPCGAWR
ncbi:MAG TPA: hypothetical protein VIG55_12800 [Methylosinus sp.]